MLRFQSRCRLALAPAVLLTAAASAVLAAPVYIPSGLNPGDSYRLVFVTGYAPGSSSNLSVYDAFLTSTANSRPELAALGATWQVIGSTATVNAYDHIGGSFTIPIYNLAGQLVASGSAGLWDGTIDNPILYDETGFANPGQVWTGSFSDGSAAINGSDSNTLGDPNPYAGNDENTDSTWITYSTPSAGNVFRLFYGISSTLVVPQAVPEPGTLGLLAVGLAALWRRRIVRSRARL